MNTKIIFAISAIVAGATTGISSHACIQEGKIRSIEIKKSKAVATLENGFRLHYMTKTSTAHIIEGAAAHDNPICISNMGIDEKNPNEGYPVQLVANVNLSGVQKSDVQECIKKGFIKRAITNPNYNWFYLQDGFVARVVHISRQTPKLFEATFTKKEICITRMDLGGSGPSWGIPYRVELISN